MECLNIRTSSVPWITNLVRHSATKPRLCGDPMYFIFFFFGVDWGNYRETLFTFLRSSRWREIALRPSYHLKGIAFLLLMSRQMLTHHHHYHHRETNARNTRQILQEQPSLGMTSFHAKFQTNQKPKHQEQIRTTF